MPNDALTLKYNQPVLVHVEGKNSANLVKAVTDIKFVVAHPQVSVMPGTNIQDFIITNTHPSATGSGGKITWTAKNEIGVEIAGESPYTLVPADPAITLEVKLVV